MKNDGLELGPRPRLAAELAELGEPGLIGGRVMAQHRGHWLVSLVGGAEAASEPQLLPARGMLREDPPAVGDWVAVDQAGAVVSVLKRHGTLMRQSTGGATAAQVLAANVDLALIVAPLPEPNERRVERLVAVAVSASVPAVLVLTKADLDPNGRETADHNLQNLTLSAALAVSALDGTGLDELRALLEPGETAALLGPSGAGKSTLVNTLLGSERQATRPVRAGDGRGRHVTVARELIELPDGALIIDTPGVRSVGLWDGAEDVFTEIDRLAASCRFADCQHESEPGCAVRDAVESEQLAAWRNLALEQEALANRKAGAADRKQRSKLLSQRVKAEKRAERNR